MAHIRQIITEGDPILRKQAVQVRRFNMVLHKLLDDMKYTMYQADGVGLAAPQIAISKQIVVMDDREHGYLELVNPRIVESSGSEIGTEYCLSVPRCGGRVNRATKIKVEYQNRNGEPQTVEAEGFFARVFQHEIDHLVGKLFIDIMTEEVRDDD